MHIGVKIETELMYERGTPCTLLDSLELIPWLCSHYYDQRIVRLCLSLLKLWSVDVRALVIGGEAWQRPRLTMYCGTIPRTAYEGN